MSNFYHLAFCKKCDNMTKHVFMDDTPRPQLYTVECTKCGHRPIQGEDASTVMPDIRAMEQVDEFEGWY